MTPFIATRRDLRVGMIFTQRFDPAPGFWWLYQRGLLRGFYPGEDDTWKHGNRARLSNVPGKDPLIVVGRVEFPRILRRPFPPRWSVEGFAVVSSYEAASERFWPAFLSGLGDLWTLRETLFPFKLSLRTSPNRPRRHRHD